MTDSVKISDIDQIALRKLGKAFSEAIGNASASTGPRNNNSSSSSSGSETRATRENQRAQEDAAEAAEDLSDTMSAVNKSYREQKRGLKANYTALESLTNGYGRTVKAQSQSLSGLLGHYQKSNEATEKMTEKMFKTSSHLTMMNKYLSSTASTLEDLDVAQAKASKSAWHLESTMKDHNGSIADLINSYEQIEKTNSRALTAQEKLLLANAKEAGLVGKSNSAYVEHIAGVKSNLKAMQKAAEAHLKLQERISWVHEKFGVFGKVITGSLTPLGMFNAGLLLVGSSLMGAWEQFKVIADSGMIREWGSIKKAQFELGISFEQATKLFQENARIVGSIGGKQFQGALKTSQENLTRYGVSLEDATSATAEFTANAVKGGINIRDTAKLNKSIKSQSEAFLKMHATSGTTIAEFKAMNSEMMSNTAVQETLNGLNKEERASKIDGMMKLRQTFANMGMSAQTAQKAMMALQDIGKQKVADRFEQAAKIQQAAAIAGLSNGQQLADIYRKGKRASAEEQAILQAGAGDMAKSMDQMAMGSYGLENVTNMLEENLQGPFAIMMESGREQKLAADAMGVMSEKQAEALKESMRLNELAFEGLKKEGQIKQLMTDPIVKAILGVAIAIAGLGLMITKGAIGVGVKLIAAGTSNIYELLKSKMSGASASTPERSRPRASRARGHANAARTARVSGAGAHVGPITNIEPGTSGRGGRGTMTPGERVRANLGRHPQTRIEPELTRPAGGPTESEIRQAHAINNTRNRIANRTATPSPARSGIGGKILNFGSKIMGSKAGGVAGKVLKVGAKVGAKAILGGLTMGILPAVMGAMENMADSESILGLDTTKGESATIGQKLIVGLMGMLKGVTFGAFDGWIDETTRWLASNEIMDKVSDVMSSIKDGIAHGWIKTLGVFEKIVKWGQIAIGNVKSTFSLIGTSLTSIKETFVLGFDSMIASIIDVMASMVDNPLLKTILPDSVLNGILEQKKQADERKALALTTLNATNDQYDSIKADLAKNHDAEYAKIDEDTKNSIAAYDAKQAAAKVEATNAKKAQALAKETTKAAEATATAGATVSEKLVKSSSEFLGLSENIMSGQEIMAQGVAEVSASTTTAVAETPVANGVKSAVINTPATETTKETKEEQQKTLLEQLILLNKTGTDTLETEKQQLVLLQALVEVNEKASAIVQMKTISNNDMHAPTVTRAAFLQRP